MDVTKSHLKYPFGKFCSEGVFPSLYDDNILQRECLMWIWCAQYWAGVRSRELPGDWFNLSLLHWRHGELRNKKYKMLQIFSITYLCFYAKQVFNALHICCFQRFVFLDLVTLGDCPSSCHSDLQVAPYSWANKNNTSKYGTCEPSCILFEASLPPSDSSLVLLIQTRTEYQIIMIRHISDLRYLRQGDKSSEEGNPEREGRWCGFGRKLDWNEWNVGS